MAENEIPTIDVFADKSIVFNENINFQFTLSDINSDMVKYKVMINGSMFLDWSELKVSPYSGSFAIPAISLNLGLNTVTIEYSDNLELGGTWSTQVKKKDFESSYVSSTYPDTKYGNYSFTLNVSNLDVTLIKFPEIEENLGYVLSSLIRLNVISGSGNISVSPILSTWNESEVTYNTKPNIDYSTSVNIEILDIGINEKDITALEKIIYSVPTYGLALTSTSSFIIDTNENDLTFTYEPTEILLPDVVYSNKVKISWRPLILSKPEAFYKVRLLRSITSDFIDSSIITETFNIDTLSYTDTTVTTGTYYYKLEVYFSDYVFIGNQLDFDFDDRSLFIEQDNVNGTNFAGGVVQLASKPLFVVMQNCDSSNGFIYDNTKIVFSDGKIQLLSDTTYPTETQEVIFPSVVTSDRCGITSISVVDSTESQLSVSVNTSMNDEGSLGSGRLWTYPVNKHATLLEVK